MDNKGKGIKTNKPTTDIGTLEVSCMVYVFAFCKHCVLSVQSLLTGFHKYLPESFSRAHLSRAGSVCSLAGKSNEKN